MSPAFTSTRPPLVWSDPGIPGLLVIDRTDDPDALREFERLQRPRSIPPVRIPANTQQEP